MTKLLDGLRKEYDKLNPFERATMRAEAAMWLDEGLMDALTALTLRDNYHAMFYELVFAVIAFRAVHESQEGNIRFWIGRNLLASIERDEKMDGAPMPENNAKLDKYLAYMKEGERQARAWILALDALDKEIGGACGLLARMVAGRYIQGVLSQNYTDDAEYDEELKGLRMLWNAYTQRTPHAPRAL